MVTGALGAALPLLRSAYGLDDGSGTELVVLYNLGALLAIVLCGIGPAACWAGRCRPPCCWPSRAAARAWPWLRPGACCAASPWSPVPATAG
ncbi:hypothetical protein O1L55_16035 [Streptomyces albulus]|nr:hypothetical protein [Streptomyces noursei]